MRRQIATLPEGVGDRELVLLPTASLLEVSLLKSSEEAGAEELVCDWQQVDPGQVPIDFELPYDPGLVDGAHAYFLRARISRGPALLVEARTES